jgi:hypothetical protein
MDAEQTLGLPVTKMWFSEHMLELCREGWRSASVADRAFLSTVTCCCKATYLRIARQILEETSHPTAQLFVEELHCLDAMDWGLDHSRVFLLTEAFCQREDGVDFMLSRCHRSREQVLQLLSVSASNSVGIATGGRRMLSGRATTWNDLACDAWTVVAVSFCAKLVAADMRSLVGLNLLHLSLRAPAPSKLRSWPCRKAFARLKELWRGMPPEHRRDIAELRSEMFWYLQACDIATAALSLLHLHRKHVFVPVSQELLRQFRSSSQLLSHIEHHMGRACLSTAFCERADALDVLHQRAVWHASQKTCVLEAVYHCDWKEACSGEKPFPLVAAKGTLYSDVERAASTLLLDRLLFYENLISSAKQDTDSCRVERELQKQQASAKKQAKKRLKKQVSSLRAAEAAAPAALSHGERYLVHRLLATAPRWDTSCLKVKWTFFELEERCPEPGLQASSLYFED